MFSIKDIMGTKIRIRVEFEDHEASSDRVTAPTQEDDGSFVMELPDAYEGDIDICEQAVLAANYPPVD